jgi:uncharacterized LabA/DUF88 family protein
MNQLATKIDRAVFQDLRGIAQRHQNVPIWTEKAVDVMIAVDLVLKAVRNEYDAAYLLSADGDFTPAVVAARALGKKVFGVSPGSAAQLGAAVSSFIRLDKAWFGDCY